jgi:hypothetical protein
VKARAGPGGTDRAPLAGHEGAGAPTDPRLALEARLDECWERLEDVVSELAALHEVQEDAIVERTRGTIAAEHDPGEAH